jgi:hypothetical protein
MTIRPTSMATIQPSVFQLSFERVNINPNAPYLAQLFANFKQICYDI